MIEMAQAAFEAYNRRAGGKTHDGRDIPPWSAVGPRVRNCWRAAVAEVTGAEPEYEVDE